MKEKPDWHRNLRDPHNPWSPTTYGHELEAGDVLEEGDVYDSTSGQWSKCPCPGLTLAAGITTKWVRPVMS